MQKVLVMGGTGVMGAHLVPELINLGYKVDVVSLEDKESANPNLNYFKCDIKDLENLNNLLKNDYNAIVDFMIYGTKEFADKCDLFLNNTDQYVYLSSYRVYADAKGPITESTPRLLDVSTDSHYLASDDYSLHKARGEDRLKASGKTNWTIVRPTITYSNQRIQLTCLEGNTIINRSRLGKPVVVSKDAMKAQTTMTWGGDVAKMISRLVLNKSAMGEAYTTATAEHHSWEEIAEYYKELIGLKYLAVSTDEFLSIKSDEPYDNYRWKVIYDRVYDRIIDNTKILNVAGMKQSELMPLYEGLKRELANLPENIFASMDYSNRMDEFLIKKGIL